MYILDYQDLMGIKNLNRFLKDSAKESIKLISLSELSGKKIAVDISIYIYKFVGDNSLIENIYLMLSIFRYYNIVPIFIFDGKPPTEKKELLEKRRQEKKDAEDEYNQFKRLLEVNVNMDDADKQEVIANMDLLKKKFIHITKTQLEDVKKLIISYGASYYEASGEADQVCCWLALKNKVWACLSEDMDMFVYGCPRVIRYFSLLNHTAVLYEMKGILDNLGISQKQLREICVLSGTDYNMNMDIEPNTNDINLYKTLKYFKKYYKEKNTIEFYDWLIENTEYIKDYDILQKIYKMFDINNDAELDKKYMENIKIINGSIQKEEIKEILKKDGFIFAF
jgi:flap endonuclease-1